MTTNYHLRSVRVLKSRSRETACFTGALFNGDRKIADLDNDGGGGPNLVSSAKGCDADVQAFNAWCKGQPAHSTSMGPLPMNADFWISLRVQQEEHVQEVKRLMRNRILFLSDDGKVLQSKTMKSDELKLALTRPAPAGMRQLTDEAEVLRLLFPNS